jgi:hypothetical protein
VGFIKELGLGGVVGLLLGIALVSWVQPRTTGGVGLILLVGVGVGTVVGGIWSAAMRGRKDKGEK